MISASFNGTDARVAFRFRSYGPAVTRELITEMNRQAIALQSTIVGSKLSGQVLHHRSGKLAGSIRAIATRRIGTSLVAYVQGAGGPALYGRIHEYGGTFQMMRHSIASFRTRRGKTRAASMRTMGTHFTVHFPERSFMRSTMKEMIGGILRALRDAVRRGLQMR